MSDRYNTHGNLEGQFQSGSNNLVLANKLDITDIDEMEGEEYDALLALQQALLNEVLVNRQVSAADLSSWHKRWLGGIYIWAGDYRSVNLSKEDFVFAAAHRIPVLMNTFQKKYLAVFTPCEGMTKDQLVDAMAICHIEFIIIHPYREGNGRLGRLLATVMALQANRPFLDFSLIDNEKNQYIHAIHAGHAGCYEPMKAIFSRVLEDSIKADGI